MKGWRKIFCWNNFYVLLSPVSYCHGSGIHCVSIVPFLLFIAQCNSYYCKHLSIQSPVLYYHEWTVYDNIISYLRERKKMLIWRVSSLHISLYLFLSLVVVMNLLIVLNWHYGCLFGPVYFQFLQSGIVHFPFCCAFSDGFKENPLWQRMCLSSFVQCH